MLDGKKFLARRSRRRHPGMTKRTRLGSTASERGHEGAIDVNVLAGDVQRCSGRWPRPNDPRCRAAPIGRDHAVITE